MTRVQMQLLDCDYVLVNNRPIVRLFGKTAKGETVCAFYEGFLPYFYLHPKSNLDLQDIKYELEKNDQVVETVSRFLPIGYQAEPVEMLKVTGRDPARTPEIRTWARRFGTVYEADVLFKYRFMVDHGLRGMGWLEVSGKPVRTTTVRCRAIQASSVRPLELLTNAPLRYLALDIECMAMAGMPEPTKDRIIMIALSFSPPYKGKESLVLLAKGAKPDNDCVPCADEEQMLRKFLDILHEYDPDILTGYNIEGFDLPYILRRLEVLKLPRDLGRAEKFAFTKKLAYTQRTTIIGRVVVDPYDIIKRDPWVKFKRYDLATVAKAMLGISKIKISGMAEIAALWAGGADKLQRLVAYTRRDSELALRLVLDKGLLDKFFELAKVSGLLLQDSLGGQAQRHECKLLHEFRKRNFVMPCKPEAAELRARRREREAAGLKGALVLEPDIGLHTTGSVLVLDFVSLYPSLIHTFNICPTTWLRDGHGEGRHTTTPYGTKFVKPDVRKGILPDIARELIKTRAAVRRMAKAEHDLERRRILEARQLALKDLSNSLYGYTAFINARLYVMDVASTITALGRDTITKTKKIIESNHPVKVLYSDTDSVFIKTDLTDLDAAAQLANSISALVTAKLPGLELKFEKIFKPFLILAKKRYAGLAFEHEGRGWLSKISMKGIETVRRDWCALTTDTMTRVLDIILREQDVKKAARYVRDVLDRLAKGQVPLEKLTIVKGVTKDIRAYDGVQPHIELAKKLMRRDPAKGSMVGERLEFVIVKGNQMLSKRAEDPAFVREKGLEIDSNYYIESQLLPPLERIFEVCGISRTELIEGSRQTNLLSILRRKPELPPDQAVLSSFEAIVCRKCSWSWRRPTLCGVCPACGGQLYFSSGGSIGRFLHEPLSQVQQKRESLAAADSP
jgi:DNA polymerase I